MSERGLIAKKYKLPTAEEADSFFCFAAKVALTHNPGGIRYFSGSQDGKLVRLSFLRGCLLEIEAEAERFGAKEVA